MVEPKTLMLQPSISNNLFFGRPTSRGSTFLERTHVQHVIKVLTTFDTATSCRGQTASSFENDGFEVCHMPQAKG